MTPVTDWLLAPDLHAPRAARQLLREWGRRESLTHGVVEDVVLVTNEMVVDAVLGPPSPVCISVDLGADDIILSVKRLRDQGSRRRTVMVNAVADSWGVVDRERSTTVWARFPVEPQMAVMQTSHAWPPARHGAVETSVTRAGTTRFPPSPKLDIKRWRLIMSFPTVVDLPAGEQLGEKAQHELVAAQLRGEARSDGGTKQVVAAVCREIERLGLTPDRRELHRRYTLGLPDVRKI